MQTVALGWLVLQMTNSPFLLGLVGFANYFPVLLFSAVGGVVADWVDRRKLMLVTQTAQMLLTGLLGGLTYLGIVRISEILAISFLSGLATAWNAPAYQAMISDLVEPEDLMNAIGLNSTQFNLARVIGPALAGMALGAIGVAGCFFLNAASFLALILALTLVRFPAPASRKPRGTIWGDLLEGLLYIRQRPRILTLLSLVALSSVFGMPYIILMPIFARDILQVGAAGLGYLMTASGVGALAGALFVAWFGERVNKARLLLVGLLIFSGSLLAFALSRDYDYSLFFLFCTGASMVTFLATINSSLQILAPEHMRGRVMSMYAWAFLGLTPVGSLQAGSLADALGASGALAIGAALCFLAGAGTFAFMPRLRKLP